MKQEIKIKAGSGNVFADMGFLCPQDEMAKADLAFELYQLIAERSLTPEAVAQTLHLEAAVAQKLVSAEPIDCSLSCLQGYLARLNEISVPAIS